MDSLPIDNRTDEERDADRQRDLKLIRDLVDEVSFLQRLDQYARGS